MLKQSRRSCAFIAEAYADAGYAGDRPASAILIAIETVRKPLGQVGCVVHPRRWEVERFCAWIGRIGGSAEASLRAASVTMLLHRIGWNSLTCRTDPCRGGRCVNSFYR